MCVDKQRLTLVLEAPIVTVISQNIRSIIFLVQPTWSKSQRVDQLLQQSRDNDGLGVEAVGLQHLLEGLGHGFGQLAPEAFEVDSAGLDEAVELDGREDVVDAELAAEDVAAQKFLDVFGADAAALSNLESHWKTFFSLGLTQSWRQARVPENALH